MKTKHVFTVLALAFMVAFSTFASATTGAIYTSLGNGVIVNKNLYDQKPDVYLNGGPQNVHGGGLSPNGEYYFQVTDPSGKIVLSTDNVECRKVLVSGGKIVGVPNHAPLPACTTGWHAPGATDASNGQTPVQMIPFNDTPNAGGEYEAWISTGPDFINSTTKTDNFKVKKPGAAYISVCKFNDLNNNGVQDSGEPLLAHWTINATGVDGDTGSGVQAQTNDFGCVTFSFSGFSGDVSSRAVTLSEVQQQGWTQTSPVDGNGVVVLQSFTLNPNDKIDAPNFGNFFPTDPCVVDPLSCAPPPGQSVLNVTKTAFPSLDRKFVWGITKSVDNSRINSSSSSAQFNYTVEVTHDAGTDSNWQASGNIEVANVGNADATGVNVTDDNPNCVVSNGTGLVIPQGTHVDVSYTCNFDAQPDVFLNTASALADDGGAGNGSASVDFSTAAVNKIDDSITVTDTLGGSLGSASSTDASPIDFNYSYTVNGTPGTCTSQGNTASFVTNSTQATGSDSKSVMLCVGADLSVSKTASTSFNSDISKSVDRSLVENASGSNTFNYTVVVHEGGWAVAGNIHVSNPNDWEAISATVSDPLCSLSQVVSVGAGSAVDVPYSCALPGVPAVSGTNNASAAWDSAAAYTPDASAAGSAGFSFAALHVTDAFNGGAPVALGTISAPTATSTFLYSRVETALPGTCVVRPNTAAITETGANASASATICDTNTGALTMGFWQGPNGVKAINTNCIGARAALKSYAPFADLPATGTCAALTTYVGKVQNAANSSGGGGLMLKGQMMATILTSYFSSKSPNPLAPQGTMNNMGNVWIQLAPIAGSLDVRNAFINYNTTTSKYAEQIWTMLSDASANWAASHCSSTTGACTSGGVYVNKAVLTNASTAFADINQRQANIAPAP